MPTVFQHLSEVWEIMNMTRMYILNVGRRHMVNKPLPKTKVQHILGQGGRKVLNPWRSISNLIEDDLHEQDCIRVCLIHHCVSST